MHTEPAGQQSVRTQLPSQSQRNTISVQSTIVATDVSNKSPDFSAINDSKLKTVLERRHDGVQQVNIVDSKTGEAVAQLPPDQVVHIVDAFIWQIKQRKDHYGRYDR